MKNKVKFPLLPHSGQFWDNVVRNKISALNKGSNSFCVSFKFFNVFLFTSSFQIL